MTETTINVEPIYIALAIYFVVVIIHGLHKIATDVPKRPLFDPTEDIVVRIIEKKVKLIDLHKRSKLVDQTYPQGFKEKMIENGKQVFLQEQVLPLIECKKLELQNAVSWPQGYEEWEFKLTIAK